MSYEFNKLYTALSVVEPLGEAFMEVVDTLRPDAVEAIVALSERVIAICTELREVSG